MSGLRSAVLRADGEDGPDAPEAFRRDADARLDRAAALAEAGAFVNLDARLREPRSSCLGQPCRPFVPPIRVEAAHAIRRLESWEPADGGHLRDLCARLLGFYWMGPPDPGGEPEFGYRLTPSEDDVQIEAAARICSLSPEAASVLGPARPASAPGPA